MVSRRAVLITGAARGIGRGIAEEFTRDHEVAITYNSTDPGPLLSEHPGVAAFPADLTVPNVAETIIAQTVERFGRLDVLVFNAGAVGADDEADPSTLFDVNVLSPHRLLQAALPHLSEGAAVVAISSVNARLPAQSAVLYSASKAALDTWVKGMAKNLGPRGIRVNAVAPGATETPESPRPDDLVALFTSMTALGRSGTPSDIASAVRFLASDDARFITGEVLTVSGGYRL